MSLRPLNKFELRTERAQTQKPSAEAPKSSIAKPLIYATLGALGLCLAAYMLHSRLAPLNPAPSNPQTTPKASDLNDAPISPSPVSLDTPTPATNQNLTPMSPVALDTPLTAANLNDAPISPSPVSLDTPTPATNQNLTPMSPVALDTPLTAANLNDAPISPSPVSLDTPAPATNQNLTPMSPVALDTPASLANLPNQEESSAPIYQRSLPVDPNECQSALEGYRESAGISKIANAMGGKEKFCALPVLSWQDSFVLDKPDRIINGVSVSDLSHPMMRGSDPSGRHYVSLRTEDTFLKDPSQPALISAETLFERDPMSRKNWASGSYYFPFERDPMSRKNWASGSYYFLASSIAPQGVVDKVALERLKALSQGKSIEMPRLDGKVVFKKLV